MSWMSFFRAGHAAQVVTRAALAAALCLAVGSAPAAPKQTARSKQKATAEAAREAGFDIASTGEAGVDRLLGSIDPELKLLHLAGEDRREPDDAKQQIQVVPVYRSKARDNVDLQSAGGCVALIHSPRAAERFGHLVDWSHIDRETIAIAAISPDAASAVGEGWAAVEAADAPNDDALLALTERLCNKVRAT